jgi:hypothetical protein
VLEIAIQTAISRHGVAVVVNPGDVALRDAVEQQPRLRFAEPKPTVCPSEVPQCRSSRSTLLDRTILGPTARFISAPPGAIENWKSICFS